MMTLHELNKKRLKGKLVLF